MKLLKNRAPSKAVRTDIMSERFLKETADEVAIGLALIFQVSLHEASTTYSRKIIWAAVDA